MRLLKQYQTHLKKQTGYIAEGNAKSGRALRQYNREQIRQHPEWFPAPLKMNDRRQQALVGGNHSLSSDRLHNVTEVAVHRLEQQLDKPYIQEGTRPDKGFGCSGLVFHAYNKVPEAKLPHTANKMYHYRRTTIVANNDLRREDLLFFHIHSRETADHVDVYLGDGQFIESPRTGETIRVSRLAEPFWQDHFLGTRRILTEETILQAGQGVHAASDGCAPMSDVTLRVSSCLQICAFLASRFPDLTQHHCRLFLFFLPLRKRGRYV